MTAQPQSLRTLFVEAEHLRHDVESGSAQDPASVLSSAISKYKASAEAVDGVSLFSSNEELEDISSTDLQYLLIDFHIAQLTFRLASGDRKNNLLDARRSHERFLSRLDDYRILDKQSVDTFERYQENPANFTVVLTSDAGRRRDIKISNYKAEKALKDKLEHLRSNPRALQNDESALRDLHLTNITLSVHQSFQALEGFSQELQILSALASRPEPPMPQPSSDGRERTHSRGEYSERLDHPLSQLSSNGRRGPILNQDGRPLRPFTLLDTRQRMQQGVFGPDHSLPTMTIDEYLEEEQKRGGMIDGGGPQSQQRAPVDEDDMEKADEATMKAREWDEFAEENPKGSGNTMNMG